VSTSEHDPNVWGHNIESALPSQRLYEQHEKRMWRNWSLLVSLILVIMLGSLTDLIPGVQARTSDSPLWAGAMLGMKVLVMLGALGITLYLSVQQRTAFADRRQLYASLDAASRKVQDNTKRLMSMLDVTRTLATEVEEQTIFDRIVDTCFQTFECDQVSMMILDREREELVVRSAKGHVDVAKVIGAKVPVGQGIAGWVAEHRKPILLGRSLKIRKRFGMQPATNPLAAAMVVPIVVRNELVGIINVSSRSDECEYSQEDMQALHVMAENAGVACRHAEQARWMRETIERLSDGKIENVPVAAKPAVSGRLTVVSDAGEDHPDGELRVA